MKGNYLLIPKSGDGNTHLFYIYKIDGKNKDIKNFSYYFYFEYFNPIILEDGKCSIDVQNFNIPKYETGWWDGSPTGGEYYKPLDTLSFFYAGYGKIESMFSKLITANIDKYKYESTVEKGKIKE